jgi:CRP/FNR family transcriptional regulator, cyclic AMP receptor protein
MDAIVTLSDVPLFSGLGPAELGLIAGQVRKHHFRGEKTVLQRDQPGIALYIILSGKVKVHNETPEGREHLIAVLAAGELFGELCLFDGKGRSADVTTLEPTEVLVLSREAMLECIHKAPQIAINLLATLAGRIRLANEINQAAITLDAPGRMAKQLLVLAREHGVRTAAGVEIGLRLTQSDLAGLIGVTRETAARILTEFRSLGWLEIDRQRRITLRQVDRLMHRCSDEPGSFTKCGASTTTSRKAACGAHANGSRTARPSAAER